MDLYVNEILYYKPNEKPRLVRIIAKSLGLDATISTKLQDNECCYQNLVELAKCPEIDHIYVQDGPVYCYDEIEYEDEELNGFVELDGQLLDICDGNFFSTEDLEKGKEATKEMLADLDRKYRQLLEKQSESHSEPNA